MVLAVNANGLKITGIEYDIVDKIFIQFPGSDEEYMVDLEYNGDEAFFVFGGQVYCLDDFVKM